MADRPTTDIDGVARSQARLLATVATIDDGTARRPSLLPGWDVAMVVTHLARNAEGHAFVAEGAALGERRRRYRDRQARDAGIEAGRGRPAAELLADLRSTIDRLDAAWAALPTGAWAITAESATGEPEPMADLPRYRWRESEIHHADLGLGFTVDDWDATFVALELAIWMPGLANRLPAGTGAVVTASDTGESWSVGDQTAPVHVDAPSRRLLAWLAGRGTDGFPALSPWSW